MSESNIFTIFFFIHLSLSILPNFYICSNLILILLSDCVFLFTERAPPLQ